MAPMQALARIAVAQLLVLGLWFSASAVAPQLQQAWQLTDSGVAWLTMAVQIGFVVGALGSAVLALADTRSARVLFFWSALVGAGANLGLLVAGSAGPAIGLRFLTGVALAGVYPSGMKVMAGWFARGRGMALGVLVGALTLGSASPHLLRGLGLEWEAVVITSSALAVVGALLMRTTSEGPHQAAPRPFDWHLVGSVVRIAGWRRSTGGYLGHMWELYAMWTWIAAWVAASAEASSATYPNASTLAFATIAVGGIGAWLAGIAADRWGRPVIAGGAMAISGSVALASPLLFGAHPILVASILLIWGFTVVADSAQFSALATETTPSDLIGTALTLQTALGFLLTLASIRLVPLIADAVSWQWAFPVLTIGPALGVWAMAAQARSTRRGAQPAR
ncbi:MAG: MFS transporter [Acidimicrobiia bacterium]|jgi:MFS family permease|nr:MAG: MFS transporter [Acidimicrobiia bacterium]